MSNDTPLSVPPDSPSPGDSGGAANPPARRAWVSGMASAACVAVWFGLNCERKPESLEALAAWGYLPADAVWRGGWWALLTSVFVHLQLWHAAFNAYWMWVLGSRMERTFGSLRFVAFFIAAAFVSSTFQMALSGATGIGASGVVYAIFGFLWALRHQMPQFREILDHRTISLFVSWMIFCFVATWLQVWIVGNEAHLSGMLFGVVVAAVFVTGYRPWLMRTCFAALCLLPIQFLLWCPWSVTWLSMRGYDAHFAGDYATAIDYYTRIVQRDDKSAWAYDNRSRAYASLGQTENARRDWERAVQLDPSLRKQTNDALDAPIEEAVEDRRTKNDSAESAAPSANN